MSGYIYLLRKASPEYIRNRDVINEPAEEKNRIINNEHGKTEKDNNIQRMLVSVKEEMKITSTDSPVPKIIYTNYFIRIKNLWKELFNSAHCDEYSDEEILEHFLFIKDKLYNFNVSNMADMCIFKMFRWRAGIGKLAYMMEYLNDKEGMKIPSRHIHKLTGKHFVDKNNEDICHKALAKALWQFKEYSSKEYIASFHNLILNGLNSK